MAGPTPTSARASSGGAAMAHAHRETPSPSPSPRHRRTTRRRCVSSSTLSHPHTYTHTTHALFVLSPCCHSHLSHSVYHILSSSRYVSLSMSGSLSFTQLPILLGLSNSDLYIIWSLPVCLSVCLSLSGSVLSLCFTHLFL